MAQAHKGQGGPASLPSLIARSRAVVDRELEDLERRKLLKIHSGTLILTREGYRALVRRFPGRGRS